MVLRVPKTARTWNGIKEGTTMTKDIDTLTCSLQIGPIETNNPNINI